MFRTLCVRTVSKIKTPLTSHSSFVNISYISCATMNGNLTVRNTLFTHGILKMASNVCREVNKVMKKKLRQRKECNRPRREKLTKKDK